MWKGSTPLTALLLVLGGFSPQAADLATAPFTPPTAAKPVGVTYHPITLEAFSRRPLSHYKSTDSWGIPPRGQQIIEGVPFLVEGKVEVTGLGAARDNSFFPTRITGIPVGALGQTIHLLHGAGYADKEGTPMAEMLVHYQSGATRSFTIAYGVHSRNWYEEAQEATSDVSDPGSRIGWYGAREDTGFSPSLRLYVTAWKNPLPDEMIETIDFYSLFSRATPAIIALTVAEETAGSSSDPFEPAPAPARDEPGRPKQRAELRIIPRDKARQTLLTNANIQITCTDGTKWIGFGQFQNTATALIDYPPEFCQLIRVTALAPGFTPHSLVFAPQENGLFPAELAIPLERGRTFGGVVRNREEQPLSGVSISLVSTLWNENGRPILVEHPPARSDQEGKWTLEGVPAEGVVEILFEHPRYVKRLCKPDAGDAAAKSLIAEMARQQAQVYLAAGTRVRGTITDGLGKPIGGAELMWGKANLVWTNQNRTHTGLDGTFELTPAEQETLTVAVAAAGYAPRLFNVVAGPDLRPFTVVLEKARRLRGRVVTADGSGVPGVTITVDQWQQTRCLNWTTQTDKNGRFVWDGVPTTAVELGFNKVGFQPVRRRALTVSDDEVQIQLEPASQPAPPRKNNKVLF